jgi:hypothetical protein
MLPEVSTDCITPLKKRSWLVAELNSRGERERERERAEVSLQWEEEGCLFYLVSKDGSSMHAERDSN